MACCLLFADVFVRRVHVGLGWVPTLYARVRDRLLRRPVQEDQPLTIDRLRSRKAQVTGQLEQLKASTRFEPSQAPADTEALGETAATPPAARPKQDAPSMTPEEKTEEESYTSRLLRAKKKVWEERKKG